MFTDNPVFPVQPTLFRLDSISESQESAEFLQEPLESNVR